jgi:hypothetical protein
MSANQPPFPGRPDQHGRLEPLDAANAHPYSPPRLRPGLGPMNSPFGPPNSDVAPANAILYGEQTQYVAQGDETVQDISPSSQGNFFGGRGAPKLNMNPSSFSNAYDDGTQPLPPVSPPQFSPFNPSNPSQFGRTNSGTLGYDLMGGPIPGQPEAASMYPTNGPTGMLPTGMLPGNGPTGALMPQMGEYSGNTGMLKLNQAVKVVKIPIPGRPGEFKTGILPILPQTPSGMLPPPSSGTLPGKSTKPQAKVILLAAMIFIVLIGSVSVYLLHQSSSATPATTNVNKNHATTTNSQAGATSTVAINATATAVSNASILVNDPLSSNARNWITGVHNGINYSFTNGAYRIRQDGTNFGYAIMYSETLPKSYTYNLTMQNISYDTGNTASLSFYGLIMNYTSYSSTKASFYLFRVNNGANITYEFDKFDNRTTGDDGNPWQEIFPDKNNSAGIGQGNGKEFTGPHQPNVYSVTNNTGQFTFRVNGKQIGSLKDTSFSGGELGMGVSQAKSEAAFSNLSVMGN